MENLEALTPERMTEFLSGSAEIDFTGQSRAEKDAWVESTLAEHRYFVLGKKECGVVRELLAKAAGLSLLQITRRIRSYRQDGVIRVHGGMRRRFPVKYTEEDLELLIEVDRAHQRLSGPATRRILEREWLWPDGIGATGRDFRSSSLQSSQQRWISAARRRIHPDEPIADHDWGAAQARFTGSSWVLASGHGASR